MHFSVISTIYKLLHLVQPIVDKILAFPVQPLLEASSCDPQPWPSLYSYLWCSLFNYLLPSLTYPIILSKQNLFGPTYRLALHKSYPRQICSQWKLPLENRWPLLMLSLPRLAICCFGSQCAAWLATCRRDSQRVAAVRNLPPCPGSR